MSVRMLNGLGCTVACCLMAAAIFLQNNAGMIPCPLCLLQRYVFLTLATVFLLGALWQWRKRAYQLLSSFSMLASLLGAMLAARQAWLQHFPPDSDGGCAMSLSYLLETFPVQEVLLKVIAGGTECAQSTWTIFYLSLAEWSLLAFIAFFFLSAYQFVQSSKKLS